MSQQSILNVVKKYARQVGIQVDRQGRRGVCTQTFRKTALNNALEHGAKVEDVQQWAGHADLRTTQEYTTLRYIRGSQNLDRSPYDWVRVEIYAKF